MVIILACHLERASLVNAVLSQDEGGSSARVFDSNQYSAVREDLIIMFVPRLSNSVAKNELTTEPT